MCGSGGIIRNLVLLCGGGAIHGKICGGGKLVVVNFVVVNLWW